jgi:ribosomal protein L29
MHSALVRLQNVFGFFTTVAFTVAAVIALSSFVSPQTPTADIQLRNVQVVKGRPHYYSYKKEEYAHVRFDLDTGTSQTASIPRHANAVARLVTILTERRSNLALQLEHQASLPLPQSRLPRHKV